MMRFKLAMISTSLLTAAGPGLLAQDEPPRNGPSLRFGGGLGVATSQRNDGSSESRVGPLADLQLGVGGRRVQLVFEIHWQPFKVPVPRTGDAVRLIYYLGSLQVFLDRRVYLRGGVGLAHANWSGSSGARAETQLAAGLAAGFETRVLGRWMALEAVWRGATGICFDDCTYGGNRVLAVQVLIPFY
jgi:hypothetical protein